MPSRQESAAASDQAMPDVPAALPAEEIYMGPQKLRVLPNSTESAASFEFEGEDHTLGNALRYVIMKNPEVEFCGYSIPHPSEEKMNVRIQTYEGTNVYEALEKGLNDLMALCDVVTEKFTEARDEFNNRMADA